MHPSPYSAGVRSTMIPEMNTPPAGFDPARDLPSGFAVFYRPLHDAFALRQRELAERRIQKLAGAEQGSLPAHLPPSPATRNAWRIELPTWCRDQRNQMTGPADDGEL